MTDVDDVLAQLSEARETYNEYVAAVDADLRKERQRRLAVRQGEILEFVAKAFAMGASKRAIMRAYNTKDFRTIDGMIATMEEQIALIKQEIEAAQSPTIMPEWLDFDGKNIHIDGSMYEVFQLEDEEYMLGHLDGESLRWDGVIVSGKDANGSEARMIWNALWDAGVGS